MFCTSSCNTTQSPKSPFNLSIFLPLLLKKTAALSCRSQRNTKKAFLATSWRACWVSAWLWEGKETQTLSGKSIVPSFLMFWEHFSNRMLSSEFQETASESFSTLVEVYVCQESQECLFFVHICVYLLFKYLAVLQWPQETKMALHTALCTCPSPIYLPPPSPSFLPFAFTE